MNNKTQKAMILRLFIIGLLVMSGMSAHAFDNYFRPGTVWTVLDCFIHPNIEDSIIYYETLDEITFEGENVIPIVMYSDDKQEPDTLRYLKTEGDKVYWRSTNPEETSKWYLLYDFGMQVGEEVVVYGYYRYSEGEKVVPYTLKFLNYNYDYNEAGIYGPLMRLKVLNEGDWDYSTYEHFQGDWIIGIGHRGGAGSILSPFMWGCEGGAQNTLRVESPKGNIVFESSTVRSSPTILEKLQNRIK